MALTKEILQRYCWTKFKLLLVKINVFFTRDATSLNNYSIGDETPLQTAVGYGNIALVKYLIVAGI